MTKLAESIQQLREVMSALRDPESGCPWDLKQDFQSLTRYSLEEIYELIDAIEQRDHQAIKEELGDILFHIFFYAHLAEEQGLFSLQQVVSEVADKLIQRHPHVFSGAEFVDEQAFKAFWEQKKQQERQQKAKTDAGFFDNIPNAMPALMQSCKIQKRVATVGFDWPQIAPVIDKIREEVDEIEHEIANADQVRIEEELGDLLFAVVNLSRHLKVDPDIALHKANSKFIKRFMALMGQLEQQNISLDQASLEQMESAWQVVKQLEN